MGYEDSLGLDECNIFYPSFCDENPWSMKWVTWCVCVCVFLKEALFEQKLIASPVFHLLLMDKIPAMYETRNYDGSSQLLGDLPSWRC